MTMFDNIKNISRKRGMSLKEVAKKSGLGENAIYRWKTETPRIDSLNKVAKTLNVTVSDITGEKTLNGPNYTEITDDDVILAFNGKPISERDLRVIKAILNEVKDEQ